MKRRILSLLLALGMVVSVLTAGSVYAEDIDGTVTEIRGGWAVKYSTTEAHNGSRSAHFKQMDGPNWDYNGRLSGLGMKGIYVKFLQQGHYRFPGNIIWRGAMGYGRQFCVSGYYKQ